MNDSLIKVVLIGDSGVGKTTMIQSYISQMPEKYTNPTIGSMFFTKHLVLDNKSFALQV
jgi:GTPase SAR1 family protein